MGNSIPAALRRCDASVRAAVVASLEPQAARLVNAWFPEWAHGGQLAPAGDWRTWVLMAGRSLQRRGRGRSG
jgi:phage terminase large subunit-like protein